MTRRVIPFTRWDGGVGLSRYADGTPPGMTKGGNCDTAWPGQIALPLAVNTATQAGTPTQTGRIYAMGEIGGVLNAFSLGDNAGTARLIRWEWDGATTTWTRSTVDAAAITNVGKNTAIIAGNLVTAFQRSTGGDPSYIYSTNGTSWTEYNDTAVATTANNPWVSNFGTSATGYALLDGATSGYLGLYSFTIAAGFTLVVNDVVPNSIDAVKTFFSWRNSSAVDVLYILTEKHLRQSNSTPNAFTILLNAEGSPFQSALVVGDRLFIGHGTRGGVREYAWDANKGLVNYDVGLDAYDGLESDRLGPVTALFYAGGWLYALVSGDAAGLATSIYKRRLATGAGWHSVYKAATANQSAAVFYVSDADDSVARLHVAQENASTTDFLYYLNYPLDNPANNTSTTFGNAVTHDFPELVLAQGQTYARVTRAGCLADDLTADETVGLSLSYDGGSVVTEGTFTSNVNTFLVGWLAGVQCQRVQARVTLNRASGTATNTPKLKAVFLEVDDSVPAMTPLAEYGTVG